MVNQVICQKYLFLFYFEARINLVGEGEASKPLTETKYIPISGEDHDGNLFLAKAVLELQVEVDMIDSRHVA